MQSSKKLVLGITIAGSVLLLRGQVKFFSDKGYDVYLLAPSQEKSVDFCKKENCTLIDIDIARDINILKDIKTLIVLIGTIWKIQPDIVNVGTPKMGLLGSIAAFVCRVPVRLYTCRGLRYEHEKGFKRWLLLNLEKVSSFFSHKTICVGHYLKQRAISDNVFKKEKAIVIGEGASNGVSLEEFNPARIDLNEREKIINTHKLDGKTVFGFVGRLINRKGINELIDAFVQVNKTYPDTALLLLGRTNINQISDPTILDEIEKNEAIHYLGFQEDVPLYMSVFDIYVQPSWWEGFSNALIQAAAMRLPIITTNATGCGDAVRDGFNATVVKVGDVEGLKSAMNQYLNNKELRREHALNGPVWAENFRHEKIWDGLHELYQDQLKKAD